MGETYDFKELLLLSAFNTCIDTMSIDIDGLHCITLLLTHGFSA